MYRYPRHPISHQNCAFIIIGELTLTYHYYSKKYLCYSWFMILYILRVWTNVQLFVNSWFYSLTYFSQILHLITMTLQWVWKTSSCSPQTLVFLNRELTARNHLSPHVHCRSNTWIYTIKLVEIVAGIALHL